MLRALFLGNPSNYRRMSCSKTEQNGGSISQGLKLRGFEFVHTAGWGAAYFCALPLLRFTSSSLSPPLSSVGLLFFSLWNKTLKYDLEKKLKRKIYIHLNFDLKESLPKETSVMIAY